MVVVASFVLGLFLGISFLAAADEQVAREGRSFARTMVCYLIVFALGMMFEEAIVCFFAHLPKAFL